MQRTGQYRATAHILDIDGSIEVVGGQADGELWNSPGCRNSFNRECVQALQTIGPVEEVFYNGDLLSRLCSDHSRADPAIRQIGG